MSQGSTCARCGIALPPETRYCPRCGADSLAPTVGSTSGAGRVIDARYEIVAQLGDGAFGPSYLVRDSVLDTQAVLKLRRYADPELAPRLAREVAAFGSIAHPNIAGVIGSGITADGTPYLVMRYIAGRGLDAMIAAGPLRLQDAVRTAIAVGNGLQALHQRGLLHRDVKPSNIIIPGTAVPEFDRATLIDFGVFGELARQEGGLNRTQAGEVFGTPAYMSPEQASGERQSVAADVYSLGLVLYEMLLPDRPLFRGSGLQALVARIAGDVTIPADVPLPPAVRNLIMAMLRVRPDQRVGLDRVLEELRDVLEPGRPATVEWTGQTGVSAAPTVPVGRSSAPAPTPAIVIFGLMATACAAIAVIAGRLCSSAVLTQSVFGIVSGLAIAGTGYAIARLTRTIAAARRPEIEGTAARVMLGTQTREALTATLALQVDQLIQRCREMGEAYWGHTVALMLKEYEEARDSKDRREALMNVAALLEKVTTKLSPWYVRHDKALSAAVTIVGILGGVWKIASDIVNLSRTARP